ncbi:MAG: type II secretion system F family protein [Actinomycetota bacterium]
MRSAVGDRLRWHVVVVALGPLPPAALGLAIGRPVLLAAAPLWWWAGHAVHERSRRRRADVVERSAVAAVDELIQHLKGGGSLGAALRARADGVGTATDAPGQLQLIEVTLDVLVRRGGAALPSLERLNDTLRSANALRAEAAAQAAQATASATMMAVLPAVFVLAVAGLDGTVRAFYLGHPLGAACLGTAVGLSHVGWWLQLRMIGASS